MSDRQVTTASVGLPTESEYGVMERLCQMFNASKLYTSIKSVEQAIAIVQTGRELGIGPSTALREMFISPGGHPTCSAGLLAALVWRDHGDNALRVDEQQSSDKACVVVYKRRGWDTFQQKSFSMEDARRAGLVKPNSPWEKYPADMLRSRCISAVCRTAFSDTILGMYTMEELDDTAGSNDEPRASRRGVDVSTGEIRPAVQVVDNVPTHDDDAIIAELRQRAGELMTMYPALGDKLAKPAHMMTLDEAGRTIAWIQRHAQSIVDEAAGRTGRDVEDQGQFD